MMRNLLLLACIFLVNQLFAQFNPISSSATDLVGLWEFENTGNLVQATVGSNLVVQTGNPSAVGGSVTSVSGVAGTDDAVRIPVGTHFKCSHGIAANGGGIYVNLFTIVVDVKIPSLGTWYSLFQANGANVDDGESFINGSGGVGSTGDYAGSVSASTWYRIAIVVDLAAGNIKYYINGTWVNTVSSSYTSVDGSYSLYSSSDLNLIYFFADDNGEDGQLDVSTIALFDDALSAAEVAALGAALPVELTSFKGEATTKGNVLSWQTASEEINEGFDIERSSNGRDFETIGFVEGNGTTFETQNYTYTDLKPIEGVNYYRLKQIDFDGQFEYSNIVSVSLKPSIDETVNTFPNPVQDELNIVNGQGTATIFNVLGQPMKQFLISDAQFPISVSDLPKGQYILQITQQNGNIVTKQFVK